RQQMTHAELVEQSQRVRVEARQPTGAGVDPVAGAVVLAVGAPAGHLLALEHGHRGATGGEPVGGGQAGRPATDHCDALRLLHVSLLLSGPHCCCGASTTVTSTPRSRMRSTTSGSARLSVISSSIS